MRATDGGSCIPGTGRSAGATDGGSCTPGTGRSVGATEGGSCTLGIVYLRCMEAVKWCTVILVP